MVLCAACGGAGTGVPRATGIVACAGAHGMAGPAEIVRPPAPTIRGTSTTRFRSCEWPAPPYAAADGYSEITVTRVPWPERAEVTNASAPDWIVAPCAEVELRYTFAKQSSPVLQQPIRVARGARVSIGGQPFTEPLPFSPSADDVVVVHNLSYSIDAARCSR